MDLFAQLLARNFPQSEAELRLGGVPVSEIAEKYGTPLFAYDASVLESQFRKLRRALPPEFSICYSVKANPQRAFLEKFLQLGCGLEIASGGEFLQALNAGCPAEKILFAGPGKNDAELELVISRGIGEIHAESMREVERLAASAKRLGVKQRVAVRVNPSASAEGGAMRMGGKPAPFGVDEEILDSVVDRVLSHPSLEFTGIHIFAGTQILDYNILLSQYGTGLEIARRLSSRLGHPLRRLDFGGGLGIPYFANDLELDLQNLCPELEKLIDTVRGDKLFAGTQFLVEPGRFLAGESGVYIARILDIKESRGKKFLVLDGGMHHHLAASGNLGQTIKRNYPVAILNKLTQPATETVDVVGPLCTPLDTLARSVSLPPAEVGDLFGIFQSGAYARSSSPLNFLSHPGPPEVWIEDQHDTLVRGRGEYSDYERDLCRPALAKA